MPHVADYQWMSAKMNGELETGKGSYDFSGSIRMRRDSVVWMSVSAFMGMESVRALITQDSVVVVNRMNDSYLAEPLAAVGALYQTSLQEIQTALLGNGASNHVSVQWGPYTAKIRYSDVLWDEPQTFPIKINKSYERVRL